jgi:hypothetical protein
MEALGLCCTDRLLRVSSGIRQHFHHCTPYVSDLALLHPLYTYIVSLQPGQSISDASHLCENVQQRVHFRHPFFSLHLKSTYIGLRNNSQQFHSIHNGKYSIRYRATSFMKVRTNDCRHLGGCTGGVQQLHFQQISTSPAYNPKRQLNPCITSCLYQKLRKFVPERSQSS